MTEIEKFHSDIVRIIKHERADNNGRYDGNKATEKVIQLFVRQASYVGNLANTCADYWRSTYILGKDMNNEPSEENIRRLGAILSFLEGTEEDEDLLTDEDWKELGELVNYEAEDLPLDALQNLMSVIVRKGAF